MTVYAMLQLMDVCKECKRPNWDGYGAKPVSSQTSHHAGKILSSLTGKSQLSISVGAEPDGSVTIDWSHDKSHVLSISVNESQFIDYAWISGEQRSNGHVLMEPGGKLPPFLRKLILEVAASR